MALEITGTLIQKLPIQKGESARGAWQKQEFVVETNDTYPKKVCFNVWGEERVNEFQNYQEGQSIKVFFNAESREYNSRWYTDLRAWKIESLSATTNEPFDNSSDFPEEPPQQFSDYSAESDLPF